MSQHDPQDEIPGELLYAGAKVTPLTALYRCLINTVSLNRHLAIGYYYNMKYMTK